MGYSFHVTILVFFCIMCVPPALSLISPPLLQDFFQLACGSGVDGTLRKRADKFKAHLTKKFRWDFEADLEDCAPVVVDLPSGGSA